MAGLDPDVVFSFKSKAKARSGPKSLPLGAGTNDGDRVYDFTRNRVKPTEEEIIAAKPQLSRCGLLVESVLFAEKALSQAGSRLAQGAVGFTQGPIAEAGKGPLPGACQGLVLACGDLGALLAQLAAKLTAEIVLPLQNVQTTIDEDLKKRGAALKALEQQETNCAKAVEDCVQLKANTIRDIEELKLEFQAGGGGWLSGKPSSSKISRQIEKATQVQDRTEQDLSNRVDELRVARVRRTEAAQIIQEIVVEADTKLSGVLQPLLINYAGFWKDTATEMHGIARKLQSDAKNFDFAAMEGVAAGDRVENALKAKRNSGSRKDGTQAPPDFVQGVSSASQVAPLVQTAIAEAAKLKARSASPPLVADARKIAVKDAAQQPQRIGNASPDADASESESEEEDDVSEVGGRVTVDAGKANYIEFVAGTSEGPLGLKLSWPPGPVMVEAVGPNTWAETSGLRQGTEILTVNGEVVASMQEVELRNMLKQRPLCFCASVAGAGSVDRV